MPWATWGMRMQLGDARRAIGYYEQALEIAREIGDRRGEGHALGNLGSAYQNLGDARRAIGYFEQALVKSPRDRRPPRGRDNALGNLGIAYATWATPGGPSATTSSALVISREIGDRRGEGNALGNLGVAYADLGDARRAIGYYEQHLKIAREIGDRRGEGACPGQPGECVCRAGRRPAGHRLLRAGA